MYVCLPCLSKEVMLSHLLFNLEKNVKLHKTFSFDSVHLLQLNA